MKKILTSVVVIVLLLSIVCCFAACNKKAPIEQVTDCAKILKDMVNDETFEVAGKCGYQKYFTFEGTTYLYIYIAIPYKVTNDSGKEEIDIAYFVEGQYVGKDSDYDDDSYEAWSDSRQLRFLASVLIYLEGEYTEVFTKEEINAAIGIDVVSGEEESGVAAA